MGQIQKKEQALTAKEKALMTYDEQLPDLISTNVLLQKKALDVIEEKIDACSAAQAATIYGILHDKCQLLVGARNEQNNQINMFFGDTMDMGDQSALMQRVIDRMSKKDDSEMEVVEDEE